MLSSVKSTAFGEVHAAHVGSRRRNNWEQRFTVENNALLAFLRKMSALQSLVAITRLVMKNGGISVCVPGLVTASYVH